MKNPLLASLAMMAITWTVGCEDGPPHNGPQEPVTPQSDFGSPATSQPPMPEGSTTPEAAAPQTSPADPQPFQPAPLNDGSTQPLPHSGSPDGGDSSLPGSEAYLQPDEPAGGGEAASPFGRQPPPGSPPRQFGDSPESQFGSAGQPSSPEPGPLPQAADDDQIGTGLEGLAPDEDLDQFNGNADADDEADADDQTG